RLVAPRLPRHRAHDLVARRPSPRTVAAARTRRRLSVLGNAYLLAHHLPRAGPVARPRRAADDLLRPRHGAHRPRLEPGATPLARPGRSAGAAPGGPRRPVEPPGVDHERLAIRRVLLGQAGLLAVGEPL